MISEEIKKALAEEFETKREFPANFDQKCKFCTNLIMQGEPFVFVSRQPMCNECQGKVSEFFET
jgi:hypothetical protein